MTAIKYSYQNYPEIQSAKNVIYFKVVQSIIKRPKNQKKGHNKFLCGGLKCNCLNRITESVLRHFQFRDFFLLWFLFFLNP